MSLQASTPISRYILPTTKPFKKLWLRWRSLRFPWRRRYFIGMDLEGNTFWEFRDRLVAYRPRRIMDFRGGVHSLANYSEFKVDPQWHQWLRATRFEPPSIQELQDEVTRQKIMVERARLADERWAKAGTLLKKPGEKEFRRLQASARATEASDGSLIGKIQEMEKEKERVPVRVGKETTVQDMEERWKIEREKREQGRPSAPGEGFQPAAWAPRAGERLEK
ncbi:hypothetical protein TWF192_008640 [Orbilia oligospora]|uniref:Uncharacterized protein n=1 Tax=Orbilia oligospora TaxID=2813651 RepID=A0A6G1M222_ORBOL|nr:hypothetical protein TWF679_008138 [Orbilia oligospora]KAF3232374.1 hypothetical protein TWF191_000145 [Orbilia oligospora]KAF3242385.1 hypothetical protein TWF192_008640 [Orbilia oligospora]